MSIFSLAETAAPSFEALIAQCTKLRLAEQQAMIADVEALLGKLAADMTCSPQQAYVPPPKPRRRSKFPGWRTMTGAQRRNAQMDAIFDEAKQRGDWPTDDVSSNAPAADVKLNAVGKPYSPQYDPKYRMRYKPAKYANRTGTGLSPVNAKLHYRWAIEAKHANLPGLIDEICARNGA